MNQKPIVLVTGATGAQGGSVARHLLKSKKFLVRCFTRNPESQNALALKKEGAEIVKGDLDDLKSLRRALEGCYGVFGVTNFWEHFDKEAAHGRNLVDEVSAAGIQHFVFSSLPSPRKISRDKLEVPHMDIKADLEEYARSLKIPATYLHVAFYYENFINFFPPQLGNDGNWHISLPQGETKLAGTSVEDVGGVVAKIFDAPEKFKNEVIGVVGEDISMDQYIGVLTKVLKRKHVYDYIPYELYASFPFPGAKELAHMFEFNRLFIDNRKEDMALSRTLYPEMKNFETWLTENTQRFDQIEQG